MNIALIGYGKMGHLIEERAIEADHEVVAIVDPYFEHNDIIDEKTFFGTALYKSLDVLEGLKDKIDVTIEFTRPDMAAENLLYLAKTKIPALTGTTGWYDKLPEITEAVKKSGASLFWAPNFSLGMNIFYLLAEYAAELFNPFFEYDAGGFESHHNKKTDSPSGTAKAIAEKILSKMTRKKKAVYEMLDRPPAEDEFHFASLRTGFAPGIHSVVFDSPADTIELTHTLRNREGLAVGAVKAAQWLCTKKRSGIFTMDDMLSDILKAANGRN